MKHPGNILQTSLKQSWITPKTSFKHTWNFLQHPLNLFEISFRHLWTTLKHHWTFVENFKHPLNFLETLSKHPWNFHNFFEILLKLPLTPLILSLNTHESYLKHHGNLFETFLKHPWKTIKMPWKFSWNFLETSSKHPWNTLETPLKHPWNTLEQYQDTIKIL